MIKKRCVLRRLTLFSPQKMRRKFDLYEIAKKDILQKKVGGGRNTGYELIKIKPLF